MKFFTIRLNGKIHVGFKKFENKAQPFNNTPDFSEPSHALEYLEENYGPGIMSSVHLLHNMNIETYTQVDSYFNGLNDSGTASEESIFGDE